MLVITLAGPLHNEQMFTTLKRSASPVSVTDARLLTRALKLSIQRANGARGRGSLCLTSELTEPAETSGAAPCPVQHAAIVLRQRQQPFTSSDFNAVPRRPSRPHTKHSPPYQASLAPSSAIELPTPKQLDLFFFRLHPDMTKWRCPFGRCSAPS